MFVIWVCMRLMYILTCMERERDECVYLSIHLKTSLVVGRACRGYELIAL